MGGSIWKWNNIICSFLSLPLNWQKVNWIKVTWPNQMMKQKHAHELWLACRFAVILSCGGMIAFFIHMKPILFFLNFHSALGRSNCNKREDNSVWMAWRFHYVKTNEYVGPVSTDQFDFIYIQDVPRLYISNFGHKPGSWCPKPAAPLKWLWGSFFANINKQLQ